MSDRYVGFVVVLEEPLKDEDAEEIRNAISMIKGVVSVSLMVADLGYYAAREQIRHELIQELWDVLKPKNN